MRTDLNLTSMFCNNEIYRWNVKNLYSLISFSFNILKRVSTLFTAVYRMFYHLIRISAHFKSCSRMTFLTSRVLITFFSATLEVCVLLDKKVSRRRFATVMAVLI